MKRIVAFIPARYGSSRFPGKPLASICGRPMIQWVYERVNKVPEIQSVFVATDDERIEDAVLGFGGQVVMTGECSCGTDRVYEASKDVDADVILNIQGDEPLISPEMISNLIGAFDDPGVSMATLKKVMANEDENDPNIVKVITDASGDAVYFSRSVIPYNRDRKPDQKYYKHIGIYGYTKDFLARFVDLPQGELELTEKLEQLRAIEHGYKIRVVETQHQSIAVDMPEHISLIEKEINGKEGSLK